MLDLQTITKKDQSDLLPEEKTELRRNVRNLTAEQRKKFVEVLSQSDPNIGEVPIPESGIKTLENQ